jgi:hypothetical protein
VDKKPTPPEPPVVTPTPIVSPDIVVTPPPPPPPKVIVDPQGPVTPPPVVTPPSTPVVTPPTTVVTPPPPTVGRMINPGYIQPTEFYHTTDPAQSKYFWGGHGPQFESGNPAQPFNAQAYNQVAAPGTPWGLQQVAKPLSPDDYLAMLRGTYQAPAAPAPATRAEAYHAPTQIAPSYGQVQVGGAVAPVKPTANITSSSIYTPAQIEKLNTALGSDWQAQINRAALNNDTGTIIDLHTRINNTLYPTETTPP